MCGTDLDAVRVVDRAHVRERAFSDVSPSLKLAALLRFPLVPLGEIAQLRLVRLSVAAPLIVHTAVWVVVLRALLLDGVAV